MDAETRAVAERLRDGMTKHDAWRECRGMAVLYDAREERRERLCSIAAEREGWDHRREVYPVPLDDGCFGVGWVRLPTDRIIPDLDAPATWGVLLGLLLVEAPGEWIVTAWPTLTEGLQATVEGAHSDEGVNCRPPGVALALARLAAWGDP